MSAADGNREPIAKCRNLNVKHANAIAFRAFILTQSPAGPIKGGYAGAGMSAADGNREPIMKRKSESLLGPPEIKVREQDPDKIYYIKNDI